MKNYHVVLKVNLNRIQTLRTVVWGHPFMTPTRRGEVVRFRWMHVDGGRRVQPYVDVHTEN